MRNHVQSGLKRTFESIYSMFPFTFTFTNVWMAKNEDDVLIVFSEEGPGKKLLVCSGLEYFAINAANPDSSLTVLAPIPGDDWSKTDEIQEIRRVKATIGSFGAIFKFSSGAYLCMEAGFKSSEKYYELSLGLPDSQNFLQLKQRFEANPKGRVKVVQLLF